jgi:membrane-associated protein
MGGGIIVSPSGNALRVRDLVEAATRLGTFALAAIALGLGFGESAIALDLIVPGEVGMVFIGAAAHDAGAPLTLLITAGVVGAVAGDSAGYFIGRRWGARVLYRWKWLRRRVEPSVERSRKYFKRRGGLAVFASRWVGALRAVMPVVAGISEMRYPRFLAWDAPAVILWTSLVVSVGFYFGDDIADVVDRIGLTVSLVIVVLLLALIVVRRHRINARSGEPTT